ncbi:hypothetical protein L1987_37669 [Smallanthus sonchifolius]|uniref:Uncharacterized protein n=1 Tax=Smallanthus sonchifolius TaxID=185202 RepID=A0ACB9HID8_9ASTR|nr:hypothetical protein L1987_37669 [Smallanthus sonchifolius]
MALEGATTNNTAKADCPTHCGNVTVPYPFGIGTNCSLDRIFNLNCNDSYEPPKLFVGSLEIYNISDSELRIFTRVSYRCFNQRGLFADQYNDWTDLAGFYTFSTKNKYTVIGCDDYALISGINKEDFFSACFGLCQTPSNVHKGQCSGIGCCQIPIPKGLSYYSATLNSINNHSDVWHDNECGFGFLVEEGGFEFGGAIDLSSGYTEFVNRIRSNMVVVLDWVIKSNVSCTAEGSECKGNSSCYDVEGDGYRCKCNEGYEGNPYLHPGCQDIDECQQETNPCYDLTGASFHSLPFSDPLPPPLEISFNLDMRKTSATDWYAVEDGMPFSCDGGRW